MESRCATASRSWPSSANGVEDAAKSGVQIPLPKWLGHGLPWSGIHRDERRAKRRLILCPLDELFHGGLDYPALGHAPAFERQRASRRACIQASCESGSFDRRLRSAGEHDHVLLNFREKEAFRALGERWRSTRYVRADAKEDDPVPALRNAVVVGLDHIVVGLELVFVDHK